MAARGRMLGDHAATKNILLPHQPRHLGTARACQHLIRRAMLQRASLMQDAKTVGQQQRFIQVVRHQQHRHRQLAPQLRQLLIELFPRHPIDGRKRFVQQQSLWLTRQCPRQCHTLLLPARQAGRLAMLQPRQMQPVQPVARTRCTLRDRQITQGLHDVMQGAQMRKQCVLLKHQTDASLLRCQADTLRGIEPQLTGAFDTRLRTRPYQTGDQSQQGALATTGGPDQRQQFVLLAMQLDLHRHGRLAVQLQMQPALGSGRGTPGVVHCVHRAPATPLPAPPRRALAKLTAIAASEASNKVADIKPAASKSITCTRS